MCEYSLTNLGNKVYYVRDNRSEAINDSLLRLKFGDNIYIGDAALQISRLIHTVGVNNDSFVVSCGGFGIPNAQRLIAAKVAEILSIPHVLTTTDLTLDSNLRQHYHLASHANIPNPEWDSDLYERTPIFIDDVLVTGRVVDSSIQAIQRQIGCSDVTSFVAYRLLGDENIERDMIEDTLEKDIGPLIDSLQGEKNIYTTRTIWYTFHLNTDLFQKIIAQVDIISCINLYLCSLEYFSGKYSGNAGTNFDVLVEKIFERKRIRLPDRQTITRQNEGFFGETIQFLKSKNYKVTEDNTPNIEDIANYLFGILLSET